METKIEKNEFLFFTPEEIEEKNYIYEITNIIEKYDILKNENELVGPKDKNYLYIINYVLYTVKHNTDLPLDIKNLFLNNITLKKDINNYLENKISNLIKNDTNLISKEINLLISISSIGSNENILKADNTYDLESLSKLFRFYELHLQTLFKDNKKLFDITFESYIILLKALFESSIINSTNVLKSSSINDIMEIIIENINIIKYNISLNNIQLSKINNILGRHLYLFTHLKKINIYLDNIDKTFSEFISNFNRQEDGFNLAKNNNFGYETEFNYETEYVLFKNYSAIFVLKLINKLENETCLKFKENPFFMKIIYLFKKRFSENEKIAVSKNFEEIKNNLLNCLILNYNSELSFEKRQNYNYVLEDFLISDNNLNNKNIETIYRILYFKNDLEDYKYSNVVNILLNSNPIKNIYQEFFKLSIFNLFIKRVIKKARLSVEDLEILETIVNYCFQNNSDIHLKSMLIKIYLNIACIYIKNSYSSQKVEELYFLTLLLENYSCLKENYNNQNLLIIQHLNLSEIDVKTEFFEKYFNKKLNLTDEVFEKYLSRKLSQEENLAYFKELLNKEIFYYIASIEFIENPKDYINSYDTESFVYEIDSNKTILFLYAKLNETSFYRVFELSKLFLLEKLEKIFKKSDKNSADYYLSDDDLIF